MEYIDIHDFICDNLDTLKSEKIPNINEQTLANLLLDLWKWSLLDVEERLSDLIWAMLERVYYPDEDDNIHGLKFLSYIYVHKHDFIFYNKDHEKIASIYDKFITSTIYKNSKKFDAIYDDALNLLNADRNNKIREHIFTFENLSSLRFMNDFIYNEASNSDVAKKFLKDKY